MSTIYVNDTPYLPGATWKIKRHMRKPVSLSEEADTAEHGADYILTLTMDNRTWDYPLYDLTDGQIEDTMFRIQRTREHDLKVESLERDGELVVE